MMEKKILSDDELKRVSGGTGDIVTVGGVVGYNEEGTVQNDYNTGAVSSDSTNPYYPHLRE